MCFNRFFPNFLQGDSGFLCSVFNGSKQTERRVGRTGNDIKVSRIGLNNFVFKVGKYFLRQNRIFLLFKDVNILDFAVFKNNFDFDFTVFSDTRAFLSNGRGRRCGGEE